MGQRFGSTTISKRMLFRMFIIRSFQVFVRPSNRCIFSYCFISVDVISDPEPVSYQRPQSSMFLNSKRKLENQEEAHMDTRSIRQNSGLNPGPGNTIHFRTMPRMERFVYSEVDLKVILGRRRTGLTCSHQKSSRLGNEKWASPGYFL